MNPAEQMFRLWERWRQLTELEGQAIEREDWPCLARQQGLKSELRQEITRAHDSCPSIWRAPGPASSQQRQQLALLASELASLEIHNRDRLRAKLRDRQGKLDRLNTVLRGLQDLRRAYGTSPAPRWQSYS
jgi:hypothetical protein